MTLELDDIQHILLTRTPAMTGRYEFLSFDDPVSARRWLMSVCVPMTSETVPAGEGVAWPRISTQRHWPSAVRKRTSWLNGWYRAICCCNTASKVPRSSGCTNRRHAQNHRGLGCPW